jgi:hypothetical protein
MTENELEYLDKRYPIEVVTHQPAPVMMNFAKMHYERPREFQITFRNPPGLTVVESVAMMYYQFDKFMKDHYGDHIQAYQDQQRAKRIDLTQTEPGTDTGV